MESKLNTTDILGEIEESPKDHTYISTVLESETDSGNSTTQEADDILQATQISILQQSDTHSNKYPNSSKWFSSEQALSKPSWITHNAAEIPACSDESSESVINHQKPAGDTPVKCNIISNKLNLQAQIQSHSDRTDFQCLDCGKPFKRKASLVYHLKNHLGIRPFSCSNCNKTFRQASELKIHNRIHSGERPFMCAECGQCFVSRANLTKHIANRHSKDRRIFFCDKCGKQFYYKKSLKDHINYVHMGKGIRCGAEGCRKIFQKESSATAHRNFAHGNKKKDNKIVCGTCGKSFWKRPQLVEHMRNHTGLKPFRCTRENCQKTFGTRTGLQRHLILHSGQKPHVCLKCDKSFAFVSHYNQHVRGHYSTKRYICLKCNHSNTQKFSAKKHVLQVHMGVKWKRHILRSANITLLNEIDSHIKRIVVETANSDDLLEDGSFAWKNTTEQESENGSEKVKTVKYLAINDVDTRLSNETVSESADQILTCDEINKLPITVNGHRTSKPQTLSNNISVTECNICENSETPIENRATTLPCVVITDPIKTYQKLIAPPVKTSQSNSPTTIYLNSQFHLINDEIVDYKENEYPQVMVHFSDSEFRGNDDLQNTYVGHIQNQTSMLTDDPKASNNEATPNEVIEPANNSSENFVVTFTEILSKPFNYDPNIRPSETDINGNRNVMQSEIVYIEHPTKGTIKVSKIVSLKAEILNFSDEEDYDTNDEESVVFSLDRIPDEDDSYQNITKIHIENDDEFVSIIKMMNIPENQLQSLNLSFYDIPSKNTLTFLCATCGKGFKQNKLLNWHIQQHKEEETLKCSKCGEQLPNKEALISHRSIHVKPHKCDQCEKVFKYPSELKDHQNTHSGNKPFMCATCGHRVTSKSGLRVHMKNHTDKDVVFTCQVCNKQFKHRSSFTAHMQTHEENPTLYICEAPDCGRQFNNRKTLNVHKKKHLAVRKFKCSMCPMSFSVSEKLREHECKHTGVKPYSCTVPGCGAALGTRTGLHKHMILHSGQKNYICQVCDKAFTFVGHLNAHFASHTGEKSHFCTICGKGFTRNFGLKKHQRLKHQFSIDAKDSEVLALIELND